MKIVLYEFQSTILVIESLYGQSLLFMVKDIGEKGPEDALFPMSVAKTLMVKIIQIFSKTNLNKVQRLSLIGALIGSSGIL